MLSSMASTPLLKLWSCGETPTGNTSTGMEDTEYRKLALRCFLTFKALAKSHWVHIMEGV